MAAGPIVNFGYDDHHLDENNNLDDVSKSHVKMQRSNDVDGILPLQLS